MGLTKCISDGGVSLSCGIGADGGLGLGGGIASVGNISNLVEAVFHADSAPELIVGGGGNIAKAIDLDDGAIEHIVGSAGRLCLSSVWANSLARRNAWALFCWRRFIGVYLG